MRRAANSNVGRAIVARVLIVNAREDEFVDLADLKGRDGFILGREFLHIGNGVAVVDDFQVLTQAFAADGQAVVQNQFGLAQGQRAAFDSI